MNRRGGKPRLAPSTKSLDVLRFVADSLVSHGFPPTIREISDHFGFRSTNAACCHLSMLERHGLIERSHLLKSRGLKLTEKAIESLGEPLPLRRIIPAPIIRTLSIDFESNPVGRAFAAEQAIEALDLAG